MKRVILLALLGLFSSYSVYSRTQSVVRGVVYEDSNQNNKKDRKERGIAGVAVSNGVAVVETNERGEYTLPLADDQIIFVIKPSGYTLPVNEYNLPQFYYIHKPNGSPELKYGGTAPTGDLPRSVDFGLYADDDQSQFRMLVFGDPQPYNMNQIDFFSRGIVEELKGIDNVAFGLSLGDLVGDNLDLFQPYKEAVQPIGVPWYNVMGNHDMNYDGEEDHLTDESFEKHFGPANYSFNHGKVHFIVLDDILYPDPRDGKGYWGGFREDQLQFVENDLRLVPKDYLVVLAFHIPISEPAGDPYRDADRERLFELLKDFPYTLSLSAHTHLQRQDLFDEKAGWQQDGFHHHYNVGTTSGDWYSGRLNENGVPYSTMRDGTPKGYAYLNFDNNQYRINYKVAGRSDDYQFEIYAPKVVEQNKRTSAGIFANFFMGSERDSVFYRVDDGPWVQMHRVNDSDPSYLHVLHEYDFTEELLDGRRPSNAVDCTHLWRGRIPTDLEVGEHTIEIKATDLMGQTHTQTSTYRIATKE
ncbi:calcineurin-like phosphoesterase C-terminal domain-containing protein [Sunxiuqinia elliptica]|uniref:3',5'-cyclic AMP phosphodiesterase CpdA n=1 Tax=Sunxiuqinia elliptica TaxID=655355 RepID=A0A4R6H791_9BACT|nr:calcineurin-like phosphoesterase family protein [Sunxiuqinia elliptica]TDO03864.1 3',5'-cyclic AMP phosphodiesterase CpdA [Sunxiuqinia elliptica]TDO62146.1 3',5'-cyclic AMP phosphodiesterase CpdA [Sunxiuqinia elliptica]